MSERAHDAGGGRSEVPGDVSDRRPADGDAGQGDMLGGPSTGAGGDLGVDGIDDREFEPGPISGHQHDLEDAEPRTDSATTVHSAANLPVDRA